MTQDAVDEYLKAGPPEPDWEADREKFREIGRKWARECNRRLWAAVFAELEMQEPPKLHPIDPFDTSNEVKAT